MRRNETQQRAFQRHWSYGALVGALVLSSLFICPEIAVACPWYNAKCWLEEGADSVWDAVDSSIELASNVVTLDPADAWGSFQDVALNLVCAGATPLSLLGSAGVEEDFDDCSIPSHPIDPNTLSKLSLYFKSDLGSVRIHEECDLEGDLTPGSRIAITFGEHIYFTPGAYDPRGLDGFALLAHEVVHVLQYRREGFGDFICEYATKCRFGDKVSCGLEQEAYRYQALVLEDHVRDEDGVFTCPLEERTWRSDTVKLHSCATNELFLSCNSGWPQSDQCGQIDNCSDRFNPEQDGIGCALAAVVTTVL